MEDYHESRRRFLRNAALAGVGLAAAPLLLPQAAQAGGLFDFTPSPADQKKVGDQAAQQILHQYKEITDGRARHFNQIGQRLVAALPNQDRQWDFRFHVIESKDVNAFALPGGNMFMYTGLYEKVNTDDALAAVTGHEMTHVRKQHWAKAYAQQQQRGLILGGLLGLTHAGQAAQTVAGLVDSAVSLKYSRGEEAQADAGGLDDMVAAGFNPQGMIQLFQMLERVSGNGGSIAGAFLSDHPLTSDRIKAAQQRIAQLQQDHNFPALRPFNYSALASS